MRKRFMAFIFTAVVLLMLFSGCGKPENTETELATQEVTEPTVFQVDEDVFYFSNEAEYGRLYSQRYDGSDLNLVVDAYTHDVHQVGESVFYLNREDLCVYHISSGETSVLIENVGIYAVDGEHLVYYLDLNEWYKSDVRYRNLKTGEDISLDIILDAGSCDIADGFLYYSKYVPDSGEGQLCVWNLETRENKTIAGELSSFHRLDAVDGGVYFEGVGADYTYDQYFASVDGSVVQKVDAGLTPDCQMFWESEGDVYCVYSVYEETGVKSSIHCHHTDGRIREILGNKHDGYFTVYPLRDESRLIMHTYYDTWIPINAGEDESHYVCRIECLLMDNHGSITPIDTAGELGLMFAGGDFPVIDSSTARKPVTAELYNVFVANYGHEGAKPLCSTTHGAWMNIADRKVDIALLAAPTKEEMDYLKQQSVGIEMKLYGGDGLVFIGNAANPVQNLTQEQIAAIYQGKIKNWNEVGGPDQPISVYYRDDQSGSQRLFEKMVFKGVELPDFEKLGFGYMDEMSTIVDIVMYDPYAIGYSIMTYLDDVYENENLKVFAVNGVEPSLDTVKDSSYLYHTQGYVVIRSDEPEDSPARRLYDWFGSPISDEILITCGITPLHGDGGIG